MNAIQKLTKGTSKAQRRAKRRAITLPNGESAPNRDNIGGRPVQEDAANVALRARCNRYGLTGKDAMSLARAVVFDSDVGACIHGIIGNDWQAIHGAWRHILASHANYKTRVIGQTGNPQSSAIAYVSEPMQSDTGHTIDTRSPEERDTAAIRSWGHWEAAINALPAPQFKWAIRSALGDGFGGAEVWRDRQPTTTGRIVVQALVHLAQSS